MESNNRKFVGYQMARIDQDELECLRKLGDHRNFTTSKIIRKEETKKSACSYRMVKLDEDELECLRKLGDNNNNTTHQKVNNYKPATNNKNKNKNSMGHQNLENYEDKRVGQVSIFEELERKKSDEINESAEKFINSFRKQLLLQRLESIENVDKMLARGL